MYCSQCGTQANEASNYCVKCGAKLSVGTFEAHAVQEQASVSKSLPEGDTQPIAPELDEEQERAKTREPSYVRPWVRYWARGMDVWLLALCLGVCGEFMWPEAGEGNDYALTVLVLAAIIVIEPWFLSKWGTTPGKALFRIQVLALDTGRKLSYGVALRRAFRVWVRGLAMGLPLLPLITQIVAYRRLNDLGVTSWDLDSSSVVTHAKIGGGRIFLIILIFLVLVGLVVFGSLPEEAWVQLDIISNTT